MDTRESLQHGRLLVLNVDQIESNPLNPRQDVADDDMESLGQSLQGEGQVQTLEAKVLQPLDDLQRLRVMFADNKQRRDLTFYEELQLTESWATALRAAGLPVTYESIAGEMGASRQKVSMIRRLAEFPLAFQEMVRDRQVSTPVAKAILKGGQAIEAHALTLAGIAMSHKLQGGLLKDLIERVKAGETPEAAWEAMQPQTCECGDTLAYGEPAGTLCLACQAKAEEQAGLANPERLLATVAADEAANAAELTAAVADGRLAPAEADAIREQDGPVMMSREAFAAMLRGGEPDDMTPPWETSGNPVPEFGMPPAASYSVAEAGSYGASQSSVTRQEIDDPAERAQRRLAKQLERERQQLQQPLPASMDYRPAQQFLDSLTGLMGPMEPLLEFAHDNAALEQLVTYLKATATLEQIEAISRFASRLKTLGTNVLFQAHGAGTFVARKQRLGFDPGSNIVDFPARQTG
jgi:hypothetical protein